MDEVGVIMGNRTDEEQAVIDAAFLDEWGLTESEYLEWVAQIEENQWSGDPIAYEEGR